MATSADALGNQQDARYTSDYKGVDLTARDCIRRGDDHEMGAGAFYLALVVVGLVTSQLHFLPTIHISPRIQSSS